MGFMGGGGGGSDQATDTIPEWARPFYQRFLTEAQQLRDDGLTGTVDIEAREDAIDFAKRMQDLEQYQKDNFMQTYKTAMGEGPKIDTSALEDKIDLQTDKAKAMAFAQAAGPGSQTAMTGSGRAVLDQANLDREGAAAKAQLLFDANKYDLETQQRAAEQLGNRMQDMFDQGALSYDMRMGAGDAITGQFYESLKNYRDLIDFRTPTQTATPSRGKG